MENNEVIQAVAETDPAAPHEYVIRKCSFDPLKHLINIEKDPNKPDRPYLTVDWRLHWLHTWCEENGKRYSITEHKAEMLPGTDYFQAECTVVIEGEEKFPATGVGGINFVEAKGDKYAVQTCLTIAKGRALANAGFGSVYAGTSEKESGTGIPSDCGVTTGFYHFTPPTFITDITKEAANTAEKASAPAQQQAETPKTEPAPAVEPSQPMSAIDNEQNADAKNITATGSVQIPSQQPTTYSSRKPAFKLPPARKTAATVVPKTGDAPKTLDEAMNYIVTMRGTWYGHPLSDVLAASPEKDLKFYAECRDLNLRTAAKILIDSRNNA